MFLSLDLGLYVSQLLHTEFPNWGAQGIGLFVCEKNHLLQTINTTFLPQLQRDKF